jgi:hypothetical protein
MTLSKQVRVDALQQMMAKIAETVRDGYSCKFFDTSMPGFGDFPGTTWSELEDMGILEDCSTIGLRRYRIKPRGWIQILNRTGGLKEAETLHRAGRLAAALRSFVEHGTGDVVILTAYIFPKLSDAHIPEDWVYCAIQSGLLKELWLGRNYDARFTTSNQQFLEISGRFGMDDKGVL